MTENIHSMKARATKVADWLLTQKPSRYRDIGVQALRNWDEAVKILEEIEDVVGQPGMPCPVQSQTAIAALRHVFGITVKRQPKRKTETRQEVPDNPYRVPSPISCGPGPYHVKIVSARDPEHNVYWCGTRAYRTEDAAVKALLQKVRQEAQRRKVWCVEPCVRHWVTENREHYIDFGSHSWYGVVTGKETK